MKKNETLHKFARYLRMVCRLAAGTEASYLREVRSFLAFLKSERRLLVETYPADVIAFTIKRQIAGVGPSTVAGILTALRAFFGWLVSEGKIPANPAAPVQAPRRPARLPRVFSVEEVDHLLEGCSKTETGIRDRALFELIYSSGLRASEALNLTIDRLSLTEQIVRVIGKGDKERIVPFGNRAKAQLERYLLRTRPELARRGESKSWVFLGWNGGQLVRREAWESFQDLCSRAGLKGTIHTLRHSFATHLMRGGAGIREIQELLGHESIITTAIYTHVEDATLHATFDQFHPRGG